LSRGPGRWQRALLAALAPETGPDVLVPVNNVLWNELGRAPSRTEQVAIRRAARALVLTGKARAVYLGQCRHLSCDELSRTFICPACGAGCRLVLVLTRPDEHIGLRSLLGIGAPPPWLSVAGDAK